MVPPVVFRVFYEIFYIVFWKSQFTSHRLIFLSEALAKSRKSVSNHILTPLEPFFDSQAKPPFLVWIFP